MTYEKEYRIIPHNYDLHKVTSFLEKNSYVNKQVKEPVGEYHFTKSKEDDFQNEYEINLVIQVNDDSIHFQLKSQNPENVQLGMRKYMKLLTATLKSILIEDDYKQEEWKRFYESVKKRKTTFTIASFVLDVLDLLG